MAAVIQAAPTEADVPPAEEPTIAEVAWRLGALESTVAKMELHAAEGFATLSSQIAGLSFVRVDVYTSDQRALQRDVENAHRLAMWAVGLTASTTIGAIVSGILALSGVFG